MGDAMGPLFGLCGQCVLNVYQKKRHSPQKKAIITMTPMIAKDCFRKISLTGCRLEVPSWSQNPQELHWVESSQTSSPQFGQNPVSLRENRSISSWLGPSSGINDSHLLVLMILNQRRQDLGFGSKVKTELERTPLHRMIDTKVWTRDSVVLEAGDHDR